MKRYDVVIIGGGAAGLCCAVRVKQLCSAASVAVLEQLPRVGKKLITTGNGRCNITNANIELSRYHSENPAFFANALKKYSLSFTKEFFSALGILLTFDEIGRAYPYSLQASSVVDALRFSADALGVETFTDTTVLSIAESNGGYVFKTADEAFFARNAVAATGLLSGGKKLGSDGAFLRVLKDLGYKTVKMTPAIVPIKTENTVTRQLKGIKVNANAGLYFSGKLLREEYGEVLFCDYGLSGPPIMQISRSVERAGGKLEIRLDLMPEYTLDELCGIIKHRKEHLKERKLEEFLSGMLNKRLGQTVIKLAGFSLSDDVSVLNSGDIIKLAKTIKALCFAVSGNCGFESSQVTAGGLDTVAFSSTTMMSKRHKGLFAVGEILDVDGDCGGFNLQWAWSSAFCAAEHISERLKTVVK